VQSDNEYWERQYWQLFDTVSKLNIQISDLKAEINTYKETQKQISELLK
jgi:hypothetical protein